MLATVLFRPPASAGPAIRPPGTRSRLHIRQEIAGSRGRSLTFTTEGFLAAFDGPARAIACARALAAACPALGVSGSFGLHTGECDLAPDGALSGRGVRSAPVKCPRRRGEHEVLVTRTVTDLVAGSGLAFTDRGEHMLVVPASEPWRLFAAIESHTGRPSTPDLPDDRLSLRLPFAGRAPHLHPHRLAPGGRSTSKS